MKIRYCLFVDEVCVYITYCKEKADKRFEIEELYQELTDSNRKVYLKEEKA